MQVLRLVRGRLLAALPGIVGVVLVAFALNRVLPGDPAAYFAGPSATREAVEEIRVQLGLDRSIAEQLGLYVRDLARGDLGRSLTTGQPVLADLLARLPASLELTLFGLALALAVALPLGIAAALKPGSWTDHAGRVLSTLGAALPLFFTGLLFVYVFYYLLGWAPAPLGRLDSLWSPPATITGMYLMDAALAGNWSLLGASARQLALPALTLAIVAIAPLTRMTRASMLAVLSSDFVRTARASGLSFRTVVWVYALRNALLPVLTSLGMVFSFLLGAGVVVEKVFAWPGVGSYALEAVIAADYAPVQGFVLLMAMVFVLLNLAIDLAYGLVDPRIRIEA